MNAMHRTQTRIKSNYDRCSFSSHFVDEIIMRVYRELNVATSMNESNRLKISEAFDFHCSSFHGCILHMLCAGY